MSHIVALDDLFFITMSRATVVYFELTPHTPSCSCKYSLECMCINSWLKIVSKKCSIYSCLPKNYSAQLF